MGMNSTRDGDWTRLAVPVLVLVASVGACSVMPPADATARAPVCEAAGAQAFIGRAASAPLVQQATQASGSTGSRVVLPGDALPQVERIDRLTVHVGAGNLIQAVSCG